MTTYSGRPPKWEHTDCNVYFDIPGGGTAESASHAQHVEGICNRLARRQRVKKASRATRSPETLSADNT
jgi:hypothetical protein